MSLQRKALKEKPLMYSMSQSTVQPNLLSQQKKTLIRDAY